MYIIQQQDLEVLNQSDRRLYARIDVLNHELQTIVSIDGELVDDSYTVDAESDVRRVYTLTLHVSDDSYLVGRDKIVWMDKYVRIYVGIFYEREQTILWYPCGLYCFDKAGYSYDATTNQLSLSCVDRMAELTGIRNGQLGGELTKIPADTLVRDAMISAVTQLGGIEKYRIAGMDDLLVPYDLEFTRGSNVYDIISELRDLYPGYETFFDDDTFVCQPYPTYASDPVLLNADTISPLVISESADYDFTQVHNVVEVWGHCNTSDYFTTNVTVTQSGSSVTIQASYSGVSTPQNGKIYGFSLPSIEAGTALVRFGLSNSTYNIRDSQRTLIRSSDLKGGRSYLLKYRAVTESGGYFELLGQYQIVAVTKMVSALPDTETRETELDSEATDNISYVVDPTNPFCREYDLGEIRLVLGDGDYDNIYSESLALQRAEYELWKATDLQDTLSLEMIDIPWLDVNTKLEIRSQQSGKVDVYLVKSKSGSSMSGTMSIQAIKFRPYYPWDRTEESDEQE